MAVFTQVQCGDWLSTSKVDPRAVSVKKTGQFSVFVDFGYIGYYIYIIIELQW